MIYQLSILYHWSQDLSVRRVTFVYQQHNLSCVIENDINLHKLPINVCKYCINSSPYITIWNLYS